MTETFEIISTSKLDAKKSGAPSYWQGEIMLDGRPRSTSFRAADGLTIDGTSLTVSAEAAKATREGFARAARLAQRADEARRRDVEAIASDAADQLHRPVARLAVTVSEKMKAGEVSSHDASRLISVMAASADARVLDFLAADRWDEADIARACRR